MLEVAIMIEGQNGLTWARWQNLARLVEDLGFAGLYRSDHFTNANPPDLNSLELWVSLTWLASHTRRIEFGPLVSPVSFRHPAFTARMAAAVDELSGGRLTLGMGAGWQAREHHLFGFDLLQPAERFDRFEEGLEVVKRLFGHAQPVDFDGRHYQLRGASLLPRPLRPGGPPILIGGNGPKRMPDLVARYAAEWNAIYLTPEGFSAANRRMDAALAAHARAPQSLRRSMMTGLCFGRSDADLNEKLSARGQTANALRGRGLVVGTRNALRDQLAALEAAGLQRVMLQWLDLDDLPGLEALARAALV